MQSYFIQLCVSVVACKSFHCHAVTWLNNFLFVKEKACLLVMCMYLHSVSVQMCVWVKSERELLFFVCTIAVYMSTSVVYYLLKETVTDGSIVAIGFVPESVLWYYSTTVNGETIETIGWTNSQNLSAVSFWKTHHSLSYHLSFLEVRWPVLLELVYIINLSLNLEWQP